MAIVELKPVLERLAGFPMLTFEAGDVVLSEGSRTGRLLFLIHGAVEVVKGDWVVARVSEAGAVLGDIAVLQGRPHTADVFAVQPSSFYVVDAAEAFLESEPLVALYVAVVQSSRIDAANNALIEARSQLARFGQRRGLLAELLDRIGGALHAPA